MNVFIVSLFCTGIKTHSYLNQTTMDELWSVEDWRCLFLLLLFFVLSVVCFCFSPPQICVANGCVSHRQVLGYRRAGKHTLSRAFLGNRANNFLLEFCLSVSF